MTKLATDSLHVNRSATCGSALGINWTECWPIMCGSSSNSGPVACGARLLMWRSAKDSSLVFTTNSPLGRHKPLCQGTLQARRSGRLNIHDGQKQMRTHQKLQLPKEGYRAMQSQLSIPTPSNDPIAP